MADESVEQALDALLRVAKDNAEKSEEERIAAIKQALPAGDLDDLAEAAKARFDAISASGTRTPELEAEIAALTDIYTAMVPSGRDDEDAAPPADQQPTVPAQPAAASTEAASAPAGDGAIDGTGAQNEPARTGQAPPPMITQQQLRGVSLSHFPTDPISGKAARGRFKAMAAGDTHDITAGTQFTSMNSVAEVAHEKLRGLADGGGGYTRTGIATWQEDKQADLYTGMSAIEAAQVLDRVCDPRKLEYDAKTMQFGQGWCRPSDLLLDLCPPAAVDGMWDVPSITISGGGIRYPVDPGFADLYSNAGFCYTEAEEIARTEDKPCYMVPCPEFEEVRLDFCGICIEAGTLVDLAYPQLISAYIAKALAAFEHKLNCRALSSAWDKSTKNDLTTGDGALTRRGLPGLIAT